MSRTSMPMSAGCAGGCSASRALQRNTLIRTWAGSGCWADQAPRGCSPRWCWVRPWGIKVSIAFDRRAQNHSNFSALAPVPVLPRPRPRAGFGLRQQPVPKRRHCPRGRTGLQPCQPVGAPVQFLCKGLCQTALLQFAREHLHRQQRHARALRRCFGQGEGRVEQRATHDGAGRPRSFKPGRPSSVR